VETKKTLKVLAVTSCWTSFYADKLALFKLLTAITAQQTKCKIKALHGHES